MLAALLSLYFLPISISPALIESNSDDLPFPDKLLIKKEGDILRLNVTRPDGLQSSALGDADVKWANGEVPYVISYLFNAKEREGILDAIGEIENKTCVQFRPAEESDGAAYVMFYKPRERTCSSMVGHTPCIDEHYKRFPQPIFLDSACLIRKVILHELMHTLGFIHEHNRSDRTQYVQVHWDNIAIEDHPDFEMRKSQDLALMNTPYTYDSIMHYSGYEFSINGKPTIVPKKEGILMGGEDELSPMDVYRINKYYECAEIGEMPPGNRKSVGQKSMDMPQPSDPAYQFFLRHYGKSILPSQCPNAYDVPKPGRNCRLNMKPAKDHNSNRYYLLCTSSSNPADPECGTWKRESCPLGEIFYSKHSVD